ncbi:MAG: hydrogen peroxide-inducible genes activator [Pseudomonadota bacterium]
MNNITLKQLRYFNALARTGHFGQAAEECAVTQPALSVQIKELETSVGCALFERTTREVRLTSFGEDFAERVREILQSVEELQDMARMSQDQFAGRLRLGIIPTIAPYMLPKLLAKLSNSHQGVDVRVRETITPRLIKELQDGILDLAIVALPVSERTLEEFEIFEENLVLVRHATKADMPVPSVADLQSMRLLLLEEGHCFRDQALAFCNMPATGSRQELEGTSLSTLVQMVGAGIGVTLIPEMAVPVETRSAPVSIAQFNAPQPTRRVGMIWRKTSPLTEQFKDIAALVHDAAMQRRA